MTAWVAWLQVAQFWMLHDLGSWDEIETTARGLVEWSGARGEKQIETMARTYQTWMDAHRGRLEAASATSALLSDARNIGDHQVLVPALAAGAFTAMACGDRSTANGLVDELVAVTEGSHSWRARQLPTVVRVLVASDRVDEAETIVEGVRASATRDRNCVLTGKAVVAEARGRIDGALEQFAEAADRWQAYGFVLEEAHAHFEVGRCLMRLGRRDEARVSFMEARKHFASLKAQPLIAETDGYLKRATALSS
jgi:tetratricopeptide (TPR) repeat protein